MKKASLIFACVIFAFVGAACGGDDEGGGTTDGGGDSDLTAFCGAVEDLKASVADPEGTVEDLAAGSQAVADAAPEEIATAADNMAAAAQSALDGDASALAAMEEAETEVATYAEDNC
jgi:hypothetical protein